MSDAVPGSVFYGDPFPIYDGSGTGTLVSGLVSGSFTKQAYLNGATNAATVTVTEIGSSGWYEPSFTPSSAGRWAATILHASYGTWLVEDVECASSSDPAILGSGTLQSASVLDATASSDDQAYRGALLIPTGGTGAGQGGKLIATYNGTTKAFTTYANFGTSLDGTTTYVILAVSDYSRYVGDLLGSVASLGPGAITGSSISTGAFTAAKFGTGAITSTVLADDAITAAKIAADAIGASELAADAGNKIADHVLRRSLSSAAASSFGDTVSFRSLLGSARKLVNRVRLAAGLLEVYDETDTGTPAGTQVATTDAAADPVTELDT